MKLANVVIALMLVSNVLAASKVGVLLPLTGPAADGGKWIQQGLQVAAATYPDIELVFEDDQCNGRGAVTGFRKLVDEVKVSLILGPLCGTAFVPLAPIAERERIILVALGLSSKRVREAGSFSLSILPSIAASSEALVDFAATGLQANSISILAGADELSEDARTNAELRAARANVKVVSTQLFDRSTQDFSVHLNKYKHENSQVLLVFGYPSDYMNVLRHAETLRLTKPLLFLPNFQSDALLQRLADRNLPIYYSYPTSSGNEREAFGAKYRDRFNREPDSFFPGAGYDALRFVSQPVKRCAGQEPGCLLNTLLKTKLESGVNGAIVLDAEGNNSTVAPFEIRAVPGGKPVQWNKHARQRPQPNAHVTVPGNQVERESALRIIDP